MRTYPTYRIVEGAMMRQDAPGGRWVLVDRRDEKLLLAALDGLTTDLLRARPASMPRQEARRPDDPRGRPQSTGQP